MDKKINLKLPTPQNFILLEMPVGKRQDGFKEALSIPIEELSEDEAIEYADLLKAQFINHWQNKKIILRTIKKKIEMEDKFSPEQNNTFGKLFQAIKTKNSYNYQVQTHAIMQMDDTNFKELFTNPNTILIGSEEEIKLVHDRARYLEII